MRGSSLGTTRWSSIFGAALLGATTATAFAQDPPPGPPTGACCLLDGACVDMTETDCVDAAGAFTPGLPCAVAAQAVNLSNDESRGPKGDSGNHYIIFDFAALIGVPNHTAVHVISINWDVGLETVWPSWLSDAAISFASTGGIFHEFDFILRPGSGDDFSGTGSYSGSQAVDEYLSVGDMVIQLYETIDDHPGAMDARYTDGSELTIVVTQSCNPAVHNVTQDTWHISIPFALITANDHDIIEASARTYPHHIDFAGRPVTVRSMSGDPFDTIIKGDGTQPVVEMGGATSATLEGFTITGGSAIIGGGGVLVDGGSALIRNCRIDDNDATFGGGMAVTLGASPLILDTTFIGNTAAQGGGLLVMSGSTPNFSDCRFEFNSADAEGGAAVILSGSVADFNRVTFRTNDAGGDGAAVHVDGASAVLDNCLVRYNSGTGGAGAALTHTGLGGVTVASSTLITNGGVTAGAIAGNNFSVWNSIIWNNAPIGMAEDATSYVIHSDVQGGWTGEGWGNIDEDPQFVNEAFGDLHLKTTSPCINRGYNDGPFVCPQGCGLPAFPVPCLDLSLDDRLQQCRVDIGAFESPYFRDCNGNGLSDSCDVSPHFGYMCTVIPDLIPHMPGDASFVAYETGVLVTGNDDSDSQAPSAAWMELPLDATGGTLEFDLSYWSDDIACPDAGAFDYPVFYIEGAFFGINLDGTLAGQSDGDCEDAGTLHNGSQADDVPVVIDLEALVGHGPYTVGIGVVSVDNQAGPGFAAFADLRVIDDGNDNGVPDTCDCPGDTNSDFSLNIDDIVNAVLCFGNPIPNCAGLGTTGDIDDGSQTGTPDGLANIDDIVFAVLRYGQSCE